MSIRGERLHAWLYGLFRPSDIELAEEAFLEAERLFLKHAVANTNERQLLVEQLANYLLTRFDRVADTFSAQDVLKFVKAILDYEELFILAHTNWNQRRTTSEWWELRDTFLVQQNLAKDFDANCDRIAHTLANFLGPIAAELPSQKMTGNEADGDIHLNSEKLELISNLPTAVEHVFAAPYRDENLSHDLFKKMRVQLDRNLISASGGNPDSGEPYRRTLVTPTKSSINDGRQLVETYLSGTPLTQLFSGKANVTIPQKLRFEHHHIVAGSGHGKTQTLQYLIAHDLQQVVEHKASVIVIDSQGDLIRNIKQLKLINEENLVLIDPTDVEFPVCLNLFDVQMDRISSYSPLHREQMLNGVLELYDFVLGSLLGAEMTQKQSVAFRYVTRLLIHIPDSTIHTMLSLFQDGGSKKYAAHIENLDGTARNFFEQEFDSREFAQTKRQVVRRLYGILENRTFNRMFSHPRSKLDLFSEMNAGKIILINTAKDLLKETGTEIFGRFFIAMITQAAQERATLPENERLPTFVYVDEAQDYFDDNIQIILSQMRKQNVALIAAHQYLDQLSPKLQSAFMSNTSIKFAGGLSAKDARSFASEMRSSTDFLLQQPQGVFAASLRGVSKRALSLSFPFGHLEAMQRQTDEEARVLNDAMRERFSLPVVEVDMQRKPEPAGTASTAPEAKRAPQKESLDSPDILPSDEL